MSRFYLTRDMDKTTKRILPYSHVIVAACFCIQGLGVGTAITYGVFFKSLVSEFGWSRATISGAASVSFLLMGLLGIFVGRLNDRIGPRKMMTVTGLFFGLGHVLMSRLGTVWQLYLFYGVVVGIGLSSIDVIALSTTARWFVRKRGIMTGIVKVGTGTGQLILPLVVSMLITSYGWRTSYIIIGVAVLLLLVSIGQTLRRDPAEMGLLPDGGTKTSGARQGLTEGGLSLHEALRTRQFWTICAVNLVNCFALMSIIVHIVPNALDIGASTARAAGLLSTIGGVSMVGRFTTGFTIDRIGCKRVIVVCLILLIAGLLWLQIAKELWMLYLFAVVYGFIHGGLFTIVSPIVAEFFGMVAHGVLLGIVVFCGTAGGAIGPVMAGYIFDVTGGYGLAFWIYAVTSVVGLVLILSLKPPQHIQNSI
jgi:MFS family permease